MTIQYFFLNGRENGVPTPCKTLHLHSSSRPVPMLNAYPKFLSKASTSSIECKITMYPCTPSPNPFFLRSTVQFASRHSPFSSPCRSPPRFPVFLYVFFPLHKKKLVLSRSRCCSPQFPPYSHLTHPPTVLPSPYFSPSLFSPFLRRVVGWSGTFFCSFLWTTLLFLISMWWDQVWEKERKGEGGGIELRYVVGCSIHIPFLRLAPHLSALLLMIMFSYSDLLSFSLLAYFLCPLKNNKKERWISRPFGAMENERMKKGWPFFSRCDITIIKKKNKGRWGCDGWGHGSLHWQTTPSV